MFKKIVLLLVVVLLLSAAGLETAGAHSPSGDELSVEKIKREIAKRGTGTKARVKIGLQDGTIVQGFISEAGQESFTVIRTDDGHMGIARTIAFSEVAQLKAKGSSRDSGVGAPKASTVVHSVVEGFFVFLRGICIPEIKP